MTAAAFAKGLLALEGELTPILVQMVKSANTNGLLDNDCDSYKHQNMCVVHLEFSCVSLYIVLAMIVFIYSLMMFILYIYECQHCLDKHTEDDISLY